jgi:hypothetical protein
MADSYSAAVFVEVPVKNIVTTVFDSPVTSIGGKYAFRIGLFWRSACNPIGDFVGTLTGFLICGFPLDDKSLSNVGKIEIVVEFGCDPNFPDFDAAVIRRLVVDKIGVPPFMKIQSDIFKESGLIVFDGEVVMGFALSDHIIGDLTLGQERIAGNILAPDIDGVEERDGGFDFVSAFEFVIVYGQVAYFFWV